MDSSARPRVWVGTALAKWPADTALARSYDRPTLVMLGHPQRSCTRASLAELAEALARVTVRPRTYVLFFRPDGFSGDWAKSDLWQTAANDRDLALAAGGDGFDTKPLRFQALLGKMEALLVRNGVAS